MTRRWLTLALFLALAVVPVVGQTPVLAPTYLSFMPSPQHDAVYADGTKMVSGYYANVYDITAPTVRVTYWNLGKPTPSGGLIRVTITSWVAALAKGKTYHVKVQTNSPAGSVLSVASNPFQPPDLVGAATNVVVGK